jgi:hypothetical protein
MISLITSISMSLKKRIQQIPIDLLHALAYSSKLTMMGG